MMELYLLVAVVLTITSYAHGFNEGFSDSCRIPVDAEYQLYRFWLVYHEDRLAFNDTDAVFDADMNFLPGSDVLNGTMIRIACLSDIHGDAVHEMSVSTCNDGQWSDSFPTCTAYCLLPNIPGMTVDSETTLDGGYPDGHAVAYRCGPGLQLTGNGILICFDGQWEGKTNTCAPYDAPNGLVVTNVTVTMFGGNNLNVSWVLESEEEPVVKYFRVLYTPRLKDPPELWAWDEVANDSFSFTLRDLEANEVYKVAVVAGDGVGEGPISNVVFEFIRRPDDKPDADSFGDTLYGPGTYDFMTTENPADVFQQCPEIVPEVNGNSVTVTLESMMSSTSLDYVIEYKTEDTKEQVRIGWTSSFDLYLKYGQNYSLSVTPAQRYDEGDVCNEVFFEIDYATCSYDSLPKVGIPMVRATKDTSFPHGDVMNFECDKDEVLSGDPRVVCNNGIWSRAKFWCTKKRSCRALGSRTWTQLTMTPAKDKYPHGSKVNFTCRKWRRGPVVRGSVWCTNGKWGKSISKMCRF